MHVQSCCFANLSLLLFFAVLDDVTVVVKNSLLRTRSTTSVLEYDEYIDLRGYRVLIRFGLSKEEGK